MSDSKKTSETRRSGLAPSTTQQATQQLVEKSQKYQSTIPDGRGKPGHSGTVGQDSAGRSKATYNISVVRQALVRDIAKKEGVHYADIVEAAIVAFANAYTAGQVDLDPFKVPAISLKASLTLEIPDNFFISSSEKLA